MKSCPHCQFLVVDDATSCGVCKQPLAVPQQPSGPWGGGPVPGFGETPPLPGAGASGTGPGFADRAPRSRSRGPLIAMVIVGLVLLVGVLGVGALVFIGTTIDPTSTALAPDDWTPYRDPAGRFSIELPGDPTIDSSTEETGGALPMTVESFDVAQGNWANSLLVLDLPPEQDQIELPLADLLGSMSEANVQAGTSAWTITNSVPVVLPAGPGLDTDFTTDLAGDPAVGHVRLIRVGADPYMLLTVGPAESAEVVRAIHDRMIASFAAPPAA